ncbi:YbhB/YbcL family Raf kinase inhibitor-like protein [Candidatus Woesearchaeota archaeon]|nr:YbhB/YbcL family Raf kinase inhibitor-like protein [Candidatus Woesearchaeota archaeon]
MPLKLSSSAFENNQVIPKKFTCDAEDASPELNIEGVPSEAKSLVLIMDDPDAPPKVWEHWTVINIPPTTTTIPENSVPGTQLTNDFSKVEWGGPCPPPGKVHHYQFKLYALDIELDLESSATKTDVEQAMKDHILEETVLVGTYER